MKVTTTAGNRLGQVLSILDADGTAVIVHGNDDQGITGEPKSGSSGGPRIACGVFTKVARSPEPSALFLPRAKRAGRRHEREWPQGEHRGELRVGGNGHSGQATRVGRANGGVRETLALVRLEAGGRVFEKKQPRLERDGAGQVDLRPLGSADRPDAARPSEAASSPHSAAGAPRPSSQSPREPGRSAV